MYALNEDKEVLVFRALKGSEQVIEEMKTFKYADHGIEVTHYSILTFSVLLSMLLKDVYSQRVIEFKTV